jgi:hypothetical protein
VRAFHTPNCENQRDPHSTDDPIFANVDTLAEVFVREVEDDEAAACLNVTP